MPRSVCLRQDHRRGPSAPDGKSNIALTDLKTGCIQGVVINGLTGERIALPEANDANFDAGKGISVRLHNTLVFAEPTAKEYAANSLLEGEYTVCEVPLEETYPLYAQVDGFLPFGSMVAVTSSVAQRSAKADADIQKPLPTSVVNIRLCPVGTQTQDLKVKVLYQTTPVAGATVQLVPSNANLLDKGNFASPTNGALLTLTTTTDAQGIATFAAGQLVLGGVYDYTVIPADGTRTLFKAQGLTIGLLAAKAQHDAYFMQIDLDNTAPSLKVVSQSDEPSGFGRKALHAEPPGQARLRHERRRRRRAVGRSQRDREAGHRRQRLVGIGQHPDRRRRVHGRPVADL